MILTQLTLLSHVQKVPLSSGPLLSIVGIHEETLSSGVIDPSTSQSSPMFAMSVSTSPGCSNKMVVCSPFRFSSAAICRAIWFNAALDAPYAAKPSSKSRNSCVEPESLEMNVIAPIGILALSSLWAQMMGPMVLVRRWKAKSSYELLVNVNANVLILKRQIYSEDAHISVARYQQSAPPLHSEWLHVSHWGTSTHQRSRPRSRDGGLVFLQAQ